MFYATILKSKRNMYIFVKDVKRCFLWKFVSELQLRFIFFAWIKDVIKCNTVVAFVPAFLKKDIVNLLCILLLMVNLFCYLRYLGTTSSNTMYNVSVIVIINFSYFHLQNHWANFNQTWDKAFLG